MDLLKILLIRFYLNFLGGIIRYIFSSIWRTILKKPKFTFKEYIYVPNSENYYEEMANSQEFLSIFDPIPKVERMK
jgi:membrane protein YqaA with SNARE-associated domain